MKRKPLPEIKACPRPGCKGKPSVHHYHSQHFVVCSCEWVGPVMKSERAAILVWNRRAPDADAERRGASACLDYIHKNSCMTRYTRGLVEAAIERGEVLPAKRKGKRT